MRQTLIVRHHGCWSSLIGPVTFGLESGPGIFNFKIPAVHPACLSEVVYQHLQFTGGFFRLF